MRVLTVIINESLDIDETAQPAKFLAILNYILLSLFLTAEPSSADGGCTGLIKHQLKLSFDTPRCILSAYEFKKNNQLTVYIDMIRSWIQKCRSVLKLVHDI